MQLDLQNPMPALSNLSLDEIVAGAKRSVNASNVETAKLLAFLAEIKLRRGYLEYGKSSLHLFCREVLHLSDGAAYRRKGAASMAVLYPAIFEMVADGRLHLTAVCELAPVLTSAKPCGVTTASRLQNEARSSRPSAVGEPQG